MGKAFLAIIALVVGVVIGAFGALSLGGGAMLGAGVATGLSAGICATVEATQEEGVMTAEQVDQVLQRAAHDIGGTVEMQPGEAMVGGATECAAVMDRLRAAAG